jgi:hypothetical protein
LSALQTGSPLKLKVIGYVDGDKDLEKALHSEFSDKKIQGEWFECCTELIELGKTFDVLRVLYREPLLPSAVVGIRELLI